MGVRLQCLLGRGLAAIALLAAGMARGQDLGERQAYSLEDLAERVEIRRNLFTRMTPGEEPALQEVGWQCEISYTRTNRWDFGGYPATGWHTCGPDEEWDIVETMGDDLRGGRMELRTQLGTAVLTNVFHIRGENPSDDDVEDLLADEPWYALPIVKHESGYAPQRGDRQFNTTGTLGTNIQGVATNDYKWCPNRSSDTNGWGLMQLTNPRPTAQQLWDWRANVQGGLAWLAGTCRSEAAEWLETQVAQQMQEEPSKPLSSGVFSMAGVSIQSTGDKTPLDICTVQRYNGTRGGWIIYWQNKTSMAEGEGANVPGSRRTGKRISEPKALRHKARSCDETHMVPRNAFGIFADFGEESEVGDEWCGAQ